MFKNRLRTVAAAFALALCASASAAAQQPAAQPQQPRPTPAPSDNYVDHKEFQTMLFNVRNRDPESLLPVLRLLTSGFKGAAVSADRNFSVITVRDFPENVASIEAAIKRLDTPESERPEVELKMYVLIASNAAGEASQFPSELKEVVNQLQSTLSFKNYQLLTTLMQRTKERPGNTTFYINGEGSAQLAGPAGAGLLNYRYGYQAHSLTLNAPPSGATTVQLGGFQFTLDGGEAGGRAQIRSDVGVREGERVVVGTAGLRDKSLILVLTAKLIK